MGQKPFMAMKRVVSQNQEKRVWLERDEGSTHCMLPRVRSDEDWVLALRWSTWWRWESCPEYFQGLSPGRVSWEWDDEETGIKEFRLQV